MRRLLLSISMLFALCFPVLTLESATAVDVFQPCKTAVDAHVCNDVKQADPGQNQIVKFIKVAINIVSYIVGIAAVVGVIVSGLRMMLANGNPQEIASARTGLLYCLAGIAVVVAAQSIVLLLLNNV